MEGSIADVRQYVVNVLEGVDAVSYAFPPANLSPPAIAVVPGDPYYEISTIGRNAVRGLVALDLHFAVATTDNPGPLGQLETMAMQALALLPTGVEVGVVSRPTLAQVGQAQLLVALCPIRVMLEIRQ